MPKYTSMNDWERLKITENNVLQLLIDYVQWKYGEEEIMNLRDECTSELNFFGDNQYLVYKQILLWLTFERKDSQTGKLAVEEFVEKFVKNKNNGKSDLANRLLNVTKNMTKDIFLIVGNKDDVVFLEDSHKKKFNVKIPREQVALFNPGRFVEGRIYPWGGWGKGDLHHFASIALMRKSHEEVMREMGLITTPDQIMEWYEKNFKEKAESIVISGRSSSLQSILNKLPPEWINAICVNLGIKKTGKRGEKVKRITSVLLVPSRLQDIIRALPKNSFEALELVKQSGGIMRYSKLVKRFNGDDFGLWWEENPPKTPIGILRIHGLLMVGKIPKGERLFKTAMIPKEIMEKMEG
jgi:hypothetical protein